MCATSGQCPKALELYGSGIGLTVSWTPAAQMRKNSDDNDEAGESMGEGSESCKESDDVYSTDTVTFKCIGASRELYSQEALAAAKQKLEKGEAVTVRILPEPNNPYDSNTIALQCKVDNNWVTIGYVVREVLQHVHAAIESKSIVSVDHCYVESFRSGVLRRH